MYKIAITGKANTGKNTVGKILNKEIYLKDQGTPGAYSGWHCKCIAFADPIKEMIRIAYPEIPRKWLYGSSKFRANVVPGVFKKDVPVTVRQLLIDIGNDFGRAYKPDIWLRNFDKRFDKLVKSNLPIVIVTDCRFRNEFDHLKDMKFFQIRLRRNEHTKIDDISETSQDGIDDSEFDAVIDNNGTLKELEEKVKKIVLNLKE